MRLCDQTASLLRDRPVVLQRFNITLPYGEPVTIQASSIPAALALVGYRLRPGDEVEVSGERMARPRRYRMHGRRQQGRQARSREPEGST